MADDVRDQIAQELHDRPLQSAIACSIRLQMLDSQLEDPALRQHLLDASEAAEETIASLRGLIDDLQLGDGQSSDGEVTG